MTNTETSSHLIENMTQVLGHPGTKMSEAEVNLLRFVLENTPATEEFLWDVLNNATVPSSVKRFALQNPGVTGTLLRRVIQDPQLNWKDYGEEIAHSRAVNEVPWADMASILEDEDIILYHLATSPTASPELLLWVERFHDIDSSEAIYKNMNFPEPEVNNSLRYWLNKPKEEWLSVVVSILRRPSITPWLLETVVRHLGTEEWREVSNLGLRGEIRRRIVIHPNSTQGVLELLLQDGYNEGYNYLMLRPFVLEKLAQFNDYAGYPDEWIEAQIVQPEA